MKKYKQWLINAPIKKKFLPTQLVAFSLIVLIACVSLSSLSTVNHLSQRIFTENVKNTEMLTEITETMYKCRVLGRDILLEPDALSRQALYTEYIAFFTKLDVQMNSFEKRLQGDKKAMFTQIIAEKNIYKDSMIQSADIRINGGDFQDALDALTSVTPIANEFFSSIDQFLTHEKDLMSDVLKKNDSTVTFVFIAEIIINILAAYVLIIIIKGLANAMSSRLIALEYSVSKIANTGDMKINIPEHLFTTDEIGLIASATNKLKMMLLDYSFKDALTGGYNATAYHEELSNIFDKKQRGNSLISFWCIVFDMNKLKLINDKYGHIEGDNAIRAAHVIIDECFSKYGKVFRIGGDEFVAILPNCTKQELELEFDNMKLLILNEDKNHDYCFSIAWGVEEFKGNSKGDFENHFNHVDKQMYQNKIDSKRV